eukprot:CAMPEP_0181376718 /NCGR_PEP_ID=MMETSP1106-20121128/17467_1 /TAXON_ID=81844 /ORGANISM="Mantoniella antarctica, Strain SL-175" /LENGTH=122 /DNA_ID=CAMNT_0023495313 /DNA_START=68 /DNA_END=436 /DNA_ORIENTATION=-
MRSMASSMAAKASVTSAFAMEKAKKEAEAAKGAMRKEAATLQPKLRAAYDQAEPSLKEFMRSPQVEYLKKNPAAVAAVLAIFCAVGIPGAATLSTCVGLMGPLEALFPILITLMIPAAEMLV